MARVAVSKLRRLGSIAVEGSQSQIATAMAATVAMACAM